MIDLHTHSLLSDGELLPSELARRAEAKGYRAIGITDHADSSNVDIVIDGIVKAARDINRHWKIRLIPGIELTHIPLKELKAVVDHVRSRGIKLIVIHGETVIEPVIKGTNRAAINAGALILSHPGLITLRDARLAEKKGVFLEISARKGHSLSNGHVAKMAQKTGARLLINSDAHSPEDLITRSFAEEVLLGAGLTAKESLRVFKNSQTLLSKLL